MLKMIKGCKIFTANELNEGYEKLEDRICANVDVDKIGDVVKSFIEMQTVPLFFFLEIPTIRSEEQPEGPLHKDVYYIDGITKEAALLLMEKYGELLINDGMSQFGFGIFGNLSEISVGEYNVVTLFLKEKAKEKFAGFFEAHQIYETDDLKTAWQTFTMDAPGECSLYECNGMTVYSLPEELKEWGIYFAERREND